MKDPTSHKLAPTWLCTSGTPTDLVKTMHNVALVLLQLASLQSKGHASPVECPNIKLQANPKEGRKCWSMFCRFAGTIAGLLLKI
eukprot:3559214-Amphidinium_carterae.1